MRRLQPSKRMIRHLIEQRYVEVSRASAAWGTRPTNGAMRLLATFLVHKDMWEYDLQSVKFLLESKLHPTRFGRCLGAMCLMRRDYDEQYYVDSQFDAGEWSGPALEAMEFKAQELLAKKHGYPDYYTFEREAEDRYQRRYGHAPA